MRLTIECPECGTEHHAVVEFGRPALPCSNPDSPAYSDPGDPGYIEVVSPDDKWVLQVCTKCGAQWNYDDLYRQAQVEHDRRCDPNW